MARLTEGATAQAARDRELDWQTGPWPAFVRGLDLDTTLDADRIAAGELSYWGRTTTIDPHAPPWSEGPLPHLSDPKARWELRRHQHLVSLAAGGRERLCIEQLLDWLARRPEPDEGSAGAYEASHRVVTWSWALPLSATAATPGELSLIDAAFTADAAAARERPSRYSSANNHRLAELAGLLAFEASRRACAVGAAWADFETELLRQTYADGGSCEQATGYFFYVLEIMWVAALYAHALGQHLGRRRRPRGGRARLARRDRGNRRRAAAARRRCGGSIPPHRLLRTAAGIAARRAAARRPRPRLYPPHAPTPARHAPLQDSGYAVHPRRAGAARGRRRAARSRLACSARPCRRAQCHCSISETNAPARQRNRYLRRRGRTRCVQAHVAHNTVTVDGLPQAQPLGPHLWGRRFLTTIHEAVAFDDRPRLHTRESRRISARGPSTRAQSRILKPDVVVMLDRITADEPRTVELNWQTMPGRTLRPHGRRVARARRGATATARSHRATPTSARTAHHLHRARPRRGLRDGRLAVGPPTSR